MGKDITKTGDASGIATFLDKVAKTPMRRSEGPERGRLIFALDATMSRERTWDLAMEIQADMFEGVAKLGGLDIQLAWFRGFREFQTSKFVSDSEALLKQMVRVRCEAGLTQMGRLFRHTLKETKRGQVNALVYVGDSFEEALDPVADLAGQLGVMGVPLFLFHEGTDARAKSAFETFAKLSGGAAVAFDPNARDQLRALLKAVAAYASGGVEQLDRLADQQGGPVALLTKQMRSR